MRVLPVTRSAIDTLLWEQAHNRSCECHTAQQCYCIKTVAHFKNYHTLQTRLQHHHNATSHAKLVPYSGCASFQSTLFAPSLPKDSLANHIAKLKTCMS